MTKVQLLTDIKALIGPGNPMQDSELTRWLNDKYLYACDEIVKENPDYFTKKETTDLVAGQFEYDLPPDFEKVFMVNANFSGTWRRLSPLSGIELVPIAQTPQNPLVFTETNPAYYRVGDAIGILPIPAVNTTDGLALWFTYTPVELANDSDSPAIPSKYHHILKYGVYADFLDRDDQHAQAAQMRATFEDRVIKMVENLSVMQTEEPKGIKIVQDQDYYFHENNY